MPTRRFVAVLAALTMALVHATAAIPHESDTEPHDHDSDQDAHDVEFSDDGRHAGIGFSRDGDESGANAASIDAWFDPDGRDADPPEDEQPAEDGQQPSDPEPAGQGPGEDALLFPPAVPGDEADWTLPDLAPRPAYRVSIGSADGPLSPVDQSVEFLDPDTSQRPTGTMLRFTTTLDNLSAHSFELLAHPAQPDPGHADALTTDAYQCVRFEGPAHDGAQRACRQYARVGTMSYHAHHRHLHIDGFATYELRRDNGGLPMYGSQEAVVAASDKVGWCVSDMERPRDAEGTPRPGEPWYVECSRTPLPVPFRMGISAGWGDTYHAGFAGQQIPIDDVPDGIYWITIRLNPPDNAHGLSLHELDRTRNTSWTRVRIHGDGTEIEVLAEMHPAPNHYSADPAYMIERRYPPPVVHGPPEPEPEGEQE